MRKVHETQALQALEAFDLGGAVISAQPYGNGHINDTFLVKTPGRDYILPRINTDIFTDPDGLMANISAVTACFNNIGPGFELVGATGNYGHYSDLSKLVLAADMLLGRLEIFPLLVLLSPDTWSRKR